MLYNLRIDAFRTDGGETPTALPALKRRIRSTALGALRSHMDSAAKLHFLKRDLSGTAWRLHASFCLQTIISYSDVLDALFTALQTLRTHSGSEADPSSIVQAQVQCLVFP